MKIRVLLVDDEKDFIDVLAERLEARDFTTSKAYSGDEAMGLIREKDVDVVLLDVQMPLKDGVTVLREIKAFNPLVEVIMLTGHSTVDVVLKHYFRPGREAFRTALETAMPLMLTGGTVERLDLPNEVLELGKAARSLTHEELIEKNEALAKAVARMTKEQRAAAVLAA